MKILRKGGGLMSNKTVALLSMIKSCPAAGNTLLLLAQVAALDHSFKPGCASGQLVLAERRNYGEKGVLKQQLKKNASE